MNLKARCVDLQCHACGKVRSVPVPVVEPPKCECGELMQTTDKPDLSAIRGRSDAKRDAYRRGSTHSGSSGTTKKRKPTRNRKRR
jgi:hypothetical protein